MFSDFFAALSLCGTRNSYIIPVFIRNVNSFSNIFLFYSPKGFLLSFRVKQSVITSPSASQTAPLPRGASGEEGKLSDMPKPPLDRSNGDDRRQRRKQGGAVGAAASRMRATAKQTLGAATRAVAPKMTERAAKNKQILSFVWFCRLLFDGQRSIISFVQIFPFEFSQNHQM